LSIRNLSAGYGQVRVIEDLSMNVQSGETVALLGTNGKWQVDLDALCHGPARADCRQHQA
jgi:branched-chain amino acid transport system ATP-binding protein